MDLPLPGLALEQPSSLAVSEEGRVLVADRAGRPVLLHHGADEARALFDGDGPRALRVRFHGESAVVLADDDRVRTFDAKGKPIGSLPTRAAPAALGVTRSGGVVVGYARRGRQDHGVSFERFGTAAFVYRDSALLDATAIAVESGALWVAGTGAEAPASRVLRLRAQPGGLLALQITPLPAPPRAAVVGPDGALYVLLEPGESIVRIHADRVGEAVRLEQPLADLARGERALLGCGPRGLADLTHLVPAPDGEGPAFSLPACTS